MFRQYIRTCVWEIGRMQKIGCLRLQISSAVWDLDSQRYPNRWVKHLEIYCQVIAVTTFKLFWLWSVLRNEILPQPEKELSLKITWYQSQIWDIKWNYKNRLWEWKKITIKSRYWELKSGAWSGSCSLQSRSRTQNLALHLGLLPGD